MTKPGCVLPKQWQPYVEQLETKVRELETMVGKLTIGALDFCKEHGVMRKPDVPWPCGMCEQAKVRKLENAMFENVRNYAWDNLELREKLEAAEATLARVEALPDKWREGVAFRNCPSMVNHPSWDECADELQAALKGEA